MISPLLFWLLAVVSVVAGLFVVIKRSPMASALALSVALVALSGLFAALSASFLFIIQILIYAGAVVVLIIFVIMLLNLREEELKAQAIQKGKFAASALLCLSATGALILLARPAGREVPLVLPAGFGDVEHLAEVLFSRYLFPFEVVSLILLVGIVGAVVVAKRGE